jgi:hypothetical protein
VKKAISPTFAVIAIILVIIIAGLLWYIYSVPKQSPHAGISLKSVRPVSPAAEDKARTEAAQAEKQIKAMEKPKPIMAPPAKAAPAPAKPPAPAKSPAPTKP